MSPSDVNLEKLRISREEINRARLTEFKTGAVIEPDVYGYTGYLGSCGVFVHPEVDIKNRWYSKCNGTFKSGFLYSDELKILSRINHRNILRFLGFCDEKDVLFQHDVNGDTVILVYKDDDIGGTLADYIQNKDDEYVCSWNRHLGICIDVAEGLNYLHSGVEGVGRVIHQNAQSKNIVLSRDLRPIIMGFYLSVIVPENQLHAQINFDVHPEDNLDPIYHETGLLDTTTDVYSYGILMFEMLIGMVANEEKVIGDYKPQRLINIVRRCYDNRPEQLIDPKLRDHINHRSFHMFIDIAYRCISFNLKDRPTMDEVAKTIKEAWVIQNRLAPPRFHIRQLKGFLPPEEIKEATNNFHEQIETGYKSSRFYKGYLNSIWRKGPIAVKRCNNVNSFSEERLIVSRLEHENIVRLMGYVYEEGGYMLVYECVENGSLSTNLHKLTLALLAYVPTYTSPADQQTAG